MTEPTSKPAEQGRPPDSTVPDLSQEIQAEELRAPELATGERRRRDVDILGLDPRTIKPDRHYRWVRVRANEWNTSLTKHKLKGYRVETVKGGVKTIVESDRRADGAICRGDLVLMSCPKHLHEARMREQFQRTEQTLASTSAQTKEAARLKGIRTIQDADHVHETMETK